MRSALTTLTMAICLIAKPCVAQSYTCASATADESVALHNQVVSLVTASSVAAIAKRNLYQLPSASASQVTVVTQKNVCKNAALAYHADISAPGTPPVSRSMIVVKVSNTRYVITDPTEKQGEYGTVLVTDQNFNVLARFSS